MKNFYLFIFVCFFSGVVFAQYTAIPDSNFEQTLINQGIDTEGTLDGQVLTSDINVLISLDVSGEFEISDLTGIEDFAALENLNCENNVISELILSSNTNLKILNCEHNELIALDVSNNLLLEELYCGNPAIDVGPYNTMAVLDVSNNNNLMTLGCFGLFNLGGLDVSQNLNLENLYCGFTQITDLDLTLNTNLKVLNVDYCLLTDLNLANNLALSHLTVATDYPMSPPGPNSNQIQSLDLSQNIALTSVKVEDCLIEELNLKNGANSILLNVYAEDNPNLVCITVDDEVAANAGDYPYSEWHKDPGVFYSENCVIGIDDFDDTQIAFYPNPVVDFLYVENEAEEITKIEVIDLLGKTVKIKRNDFTKIDFGNFKSGVYFVKFNVENAVLTRKVMKK